MPTPRSPWRSAIVARLNVGPATLDELVDAAGPMVPPAKAHRHAEENARRIAARTGRARAGRAMSDVTVAAGRRDLVRRTVTAMVESGEVRRVDDGRFVAAGDR